MLTLPSDLITEKNKLYSASACIELLEVQMSETAQTLRLTSNNEDVEYDGQTWTRFPFEPGDIPEQGDGELPRLNIRVSNALRTIQGYIEQTNEGLIGDTVIYRLVHSDHLDQNPFLTAAFQILSLTCTAEWVNFMLGAENFYFRRFPYGTFRRNLCRWKVFKGSECGYAGGSTACDRKFSTCVSYTNETRFGGFPGLINGSFDV